MIQHRFLRFALVGSGAVGLNLLLFAVLVGWLGFQYLLATVLIFIVGNGYGFLANRRWVFRLADRPARRMLRYYATMAASLGLNLLSMALLVDGLKLNYLIASVITSAWLAPVQYVAHGRVAFAPTAQRTPRPRVLLVTHYYMEHGGGVEMVAGRLATMLSGAYKIEWRAARDGDTSLEQGVERRQMRCWNGLERRFGLPMPLPSPLAIVGVARAARAADLVWVHDLIYPANFVAAVAAVFSGTPLVVTVHVGAIPYRNRVARNVMAASLGLAGRWLLTRASAVAFVSERVQAEFLSRWKLRDQRLIPNGVDVQTFRPLSPKARGRVRAEFGLTDRRVVLFVGRFVDRKGLALLRELAARLPSVEWFFAGRGPIDPAVWALPNVHVERNRSGLTLADLYGAADLLALPSVGEGFPLVVQEALAAGLPVLVDPSTIAGYRAVAAVANGESVLGDDAVGRWEARITEILRDETGQTALAPRRIQFARSHWALGRTAAEYTRLFAGVLGSVATPPTT